MSEATLTRFIVFGTLASSNFVSRRSVFGSAVWGWLETRLRVQVQVRGLGRVERRSRLSGRRLVNRWLRLFVLGEMSWRRLWRTATSLHHLPIIVFVIFTIF